MKKVKARIKRKCSTCGKEFEVVVFEDDTYTGGAYFGNIKDVLIEIGMAKPEDPDEEFEIWECQECYERE